MMSWAKAAESSSMLSVGGEEEGREVGREGGRGVEWVCLFFNQ